MKTNEQYETLGEKENGKPEMSAMRNSSEKKQKGLLLLPEVLQCESNQKQSRDKNPQRLGTEDCMGKERLIEKHFDIEGEKKMEAELASLLNGLSVCVIAALCFAGGILAFLRMD